MKRVPLALMGAGRIGRMHLNALLTEVPEADVRAVCDPSLDRDWVRSLGIEKAETDAAKIFADPSIEAVVIAAPSSVHADLAIRAARAGKQIFCEKPLTFDLARAEEVRKERDRAGVILQVGFNRRFDPDLRSLRDRLVAGEIGEPETIEIVNRDPALPSLEFVPTSGGMYFDFTIHDFDTARFLSGREIESVYTRGAALIEPRLSKWNDVDSAITVLRLEGDVLVTVINSRQSNCGYDQRVEVLGSRGLLALDNRRASALVASASTSIVHGKPLENFGLRYHAAYIEELRMFCRTVLERGRAQVGVEDVMAAIRAALAAKRSREEQRPVSIAELKEAVA